MEEIFAFCGDGIYRIEGRAVRCGEDVAFLFAGGTKPHIGAVSLAVYEPQRHSASVSTVTVYGHRDDELAASGAKKAASKLGCTVSVSIGIHVDDADASELEILRRNFAGCLDRLLAELEEKRRNVG
ncbi:MAG: hypothetical protein LUD73_06825 [Lachnospiraceae bacterium]|nr:hypothetical protein [Lachnospiraceae bacterium]MCD8249602.1 hypothetical protein [Lachnospiraceae bacterium]